MIVHPYTKWSTLAALVAFAPTTTPTMTPAPALSRGQPAPPPPELLLQRRYTGEDAKMPIGTVGTALLGRDSLVYVLDPDNAVIHVAKGSTHVRLIGGSGRGPGEMQRTAFMSFLDDSLAVPDGSLARVTLFPLRGRGVRTLATSRASIPGYSGVHVVAYGRAADLMVWSNPDGRPEPGKTNDLALFVRRHGSTTITLLAHLTSGSIGMDIPVLLRGKPANMPRPQPFVITPTWGFAREGGGAVALDTAGRTATTVTVRVRQWNNHGQLVRTCLLARPMRPLTNAAYEAGLLSVGPPAVARDLVKVDWATMRRLVVRPAALPPFRTVRLASDGTIWIRTEASFESQHEEYLVLASTACAAPRRVLLPLESIVEDARGRLFITSGYVDDAPAIDTWRY